MKKQLIFLLLLAFLLIVINFQTASAQEDSLDMRTILAREFNIPLEKIPTDKKELERFYLKEEWTRIISQNKFIAPAHNFLTKEKVQIAFQTLFAYKYEISLTFFLILLLWLIAWFEASKLIEVAGFKIKGFVAVIMGALVAVILAQIRFFKFIVETTLNLIFKPENWWIRTIIAVVALGVMILIIVILKLVEQHLKKKEEAKKKQELEQQVKEVKALNKGIQGR